MIASMGAPMLIESQHLTTSCSIGISLYPTDGKDSATLMKNADVAMYYAKEKGRNNYQFFSADMNVTRAGAPLGRELPAPGAAPQRARAPLPAAHAHVRPARSVGVEALIRWQHPRRGLLGPDKFIERRRGFGPHRSHRRVGARACVRAAARNGSARSQPGLRAVGEHLGRARSADGERLYRAVEAAVAQVRHRALHAGARAHGIAPHAEHPGEGRAPATGWASSACGLSIDDFGTGYSSLVVPEDAAGGLDQDRQLVRPRHPYGPERRGDHQARSSRWRTRCSCPSSPRAWRPRRSSAALKDARLRRVPGLPTRARARSPADFEKPLRSAERRSVLRVDLQVLHLAGERVAPDAQQSRGLDAPPARVLRAPSR